MAEIINDKMEHIEYDDFGNSTDIKEGFGYDSEKHDVTGNIYLRARYYNPRIGQFIQIDTYRGTQEDITSQNRYTYCLNNQYKYTDPSGHFGLLALLAGYKATEYLLIGGALVIGAYLLTPSGKKATKKGIEALYSLGKKVYDTVKNNNKKKNTAANKVATITTNIVSAGTASIPKPNIGIAIPIPQPCPEPKHRDWNEVPNNIMKILSVLGLMSWFNVLLQKVNSEPNKYGDSMENHHIVPQGALKYKGFEQQFDFFLDDAREVIKTHFGSVHNSVNMVLIPKQLHKHCHDRNSYYYSIKCNFPITEKASNRKNAVATKLGEYRFLLMWIGTFVK